MEMRAFRCVLMLLGRYVGTLVQARLWWVNFALGVELDQIRVGELCERHLHEPDLMVVLAGGHSPTPVINAGSPYT